MRGLIVALLFIAVHQAYLLQMLRIAVTDPNWSHAPLVPLVSLFMIYTRRFELWSIAPRPCFWGGGIMGAALLLYVVGFYPLSSATIRGWATIMDLFGLLLLLTGPMMRVLWFPVCYLVFAVRIGDKFWQLFAYHLQHAAAGLAADILRTFGADVTAQGATIEFWRGISSMGQLNIVEACSGLRLLMAFIAMGVAIVYLYPRPWWARAALLLLTVPIAILTNVLRVTVLGLIFMNNPRIPLDRYHDWSGMAMLLVGATLFIGCGWILDHLIVSRRDA